MEFVICRSFLDVNWEVAYQAYALSQGYSGVKQLAYIRSGKDQHQTFDDLSRYIDGIADELLRLYCPSGTTDLSVVGFLS